MIIRLFIAILILINISLSSEIEIYKEIKIYSPDSEVISNLNSSIHLDHVHLSDQGDLIFVVSESELDIIDSLDIRYEVLIDDLQSFYQSRLTENYTREFGLGSMGGYYTFDEIVYNLDLVHAECSDISTEKISIGQSFEGREIWAIKFSDNPNSDEDEAEVLYTGLHHAREPMSYMNLFYYMYWLCDNYGIDDKATNIINNRELWFIPAINPDGLVYNENIAPNGGGMQRKNMKPTCGSDPTGVDLNRNYDYMWGLDDEGSSGNGCAETYRGTSGFSEPETQVVRDFVEEHDFPIAFNYHSYSNLMIYPFGYSYDNDVPEEDLETFIAYGEDMVQYNGYALGTGTELLYPVNGEACDWMYGEHQIFAYTPEIGSQQDGFWPASNRIVTLAEDNLYPNQFIAIHAGAVLNTSVSTSEGPYLQGESYPLYFQIENVGLSQSQSTTEITFNSLEFDPTIEDIDIGSIDGRSSIDFGAIGYFTIPQNFQSGDVLSIEVNVSNNQEFFNNSTLSLQIGTPELIVNESFESNNDLDWNYSGNSEWYLTNEYSNSGTTSFRSGQIEDSQESSIFLDVDVPSLGTAEFSYRVSSEYSPSGSNFYDGLTFYVDGDELGQFQPNSEGESPWTLFSFTLEEGSHQLRWTYSKDGGGGATDCDNTDCDDAAFIDDFKIYAYTDDLNNLGDLNSDTAIDILDVVLLVNFILDAQQPSENQFQLADLNQDGVLNVIDIVSLVNLILS